MDLITKYNNQGLYSNHSGESHFILKFLFGALKRSAALDASKSFATKTGSPSGFGQDKILSEYLKSASLEELVRSLKKTLLHALSGKGSTRVYLAVCLRQFRPGNHTLQQCSDDSF